MKLVRTAAELRRLLPPQKPATLVPTMGGLHDGHLALARRAVEWGDAVVVSIYVNPLQFGADEDFADYPRRLQDDCDKLSGIADIVYAPHDAEMYPEKQNIGISLPPLADELCGASRPGFFQGVAVVVCKLLNQVRPTRAVFGAKDYQQLVIIRQMTRQLNMPVDIVAHPTVRAADGLALSSRNEYLTTDERRRAPALYATIRRAVADLTDGNDDFAAVCSAGRQGVNAAGMKCDYFVVRNAADLGAPAAKQCLVVLAAAYLGNARLIDNAEVGVSFLNPQPHKIQ